MKSYKPTIQLVKNGRGVWCLDTSIGCSSGMSAHAGGCYGDCYAARSAKIRGYDFSKTVLRRFESVRHENEILRRLNKIDEPFVRIGCSGDPSEDWWRALSVIEAIKTTTKEIVIITRHWTLLTGTQLEFLGDVGVCINTSVSALDTPAQLKRCLGQYNRIKAFCNSVLRVVTCDFNTGTPDGMAMAEIQESLLSNDNVIDTVFRPSKSNPLVTSGVVSVEKVSFMSSKMIASRKNKSAFLGKCVDCIEKCGAAFFAQKQIGQMNLNGFNSFTTTTKTNRN